MNKRQMLKTMRLMSNKAILKEAGRRGLALIDLPEKPYSNMTQKQFALMVTDASWERAHVEQGSGGSPDVGCYPTIELSLTGEI